MTTLLMERKVEAAPYVVALELSGPGVAVSLAELVSGERVCEVYVGTDGREALDAFDHPFARPHVHDVFKNDVYEEDDET